MTSHRKDMVAGEIKRELAEIIRNDMNDPRVTALVSVTHVEVSSDMGLATVFLSCLGTAEEQDKTFKAFRQAGGFIRGELAKRLKLRAMPELSFKLDQSIQIGARINELINKEITTKEVNSKETSAKDSNTKESNT